MADETDEQQLREKIAFQRSFMANFPTLTTIAQKWGISSPETKSKAQLIKELSDNEEQLELLLESERIAAAVRLQDELHPPQNSEDCPICFETIKHVYSKTISRLYCCGGWVCDKCRNERNSTGMKKGVDEMFHGRCPLCRDTLINDSDQKRENSKILEHANNGRAWAQSLVGTWYMDGTYGFALDKEKGLRFKQQAADQRDPGALAEIALAYNEGDTLERNESKYLHYMKEAADLGHTEAQRIVGGNFESCDKKEHLHYITLAASQGDPKACSLLGLHFLYADCGLTKSLILAKHYAEKSLEETDPEALPTFAYNFSNALYHLSVERYERALTIPGYSPIPAILFWLRRALVGAYLPVGTVAKFISMIETKEKSRCANCNIKAEGSSLKRCIRCLGAWYCGKECQVQHWKAGHKFDCIKS